jgi:hypothetical protein
MNEELATELVKEIGGGKTKFFECNVSETESVTAAVKGAIEWSKETGMKVGGVVAAAGVATSAKVRDDISYFLFFVGTGRGDGWSKQGLGEMDDGVACDNDFTGISTLSSSETEFVI